MVRRLTFRRRQRSLANVAEDLHAASVRPLVVSQSRAQVATGRFSRLPVHVESTSRWCRQPSASGSDTGSTCKRGKFVPGSLSTQSFVFCEYIRTNRICHVNMNYVETSSTTSSTRRQRTAWSCTSTCRRTDRCSSIN